MLLGHTASSSPAIISVFHKVCSNFRHTSWFPFNDLIMCRPISKADFAPKYFFFLISLELIPLRLVQWDYLLKKKKRRTHWYQFKRDVKLRGNYRL